MWWIVKRGGKRQTHIFSFAPCLRKSEKRQTNIHIFAACLRNILKVRKKWKMANTYVFAPIKLSEN